ncbi:Beta-galactosidase [Klebsormidium nitens]|uniref:Beta-galactosidase n=1 Tax=Klebsormidium nitens TaxID=105231 RepID=A0A1Y1IS49_KLENI|nr:Beta-galactosidase [Klebsormidium nitens]|eukprot:GAQ91566.1 Beta-galactosidase [Klebsormidium nitens]
MLLLGVGALATQAPKVGAIEAGAAAEERAFTIENDAFLRDGEEVQLLAGSIHYFRVHPQYWEDRLRRLQALGLNTVQTLIPWNVHEGAEGDFIWEGPANLEAFLRVAQRLGLMVMLRLGPYICAEHEFGGFPAYLLTQGPMQLRSSDPRYLAAVDHWWGELLPRVKPLLWHNGGPVIMVQVENEYGWFGRDHAYIEYLVKAAREALGPEIIVYTTDTATKWALDGGTLPGDQVYTVVDFNVYADPMDAFALQRQYNAPGKSPPMTAEFYTGWHTRWGEPLSHSDPTVVAAGLERILAVNASISLYMGHGGTNFGFNSGANIFSENDYRPVITSYDYGAPVSEGGDTDLLPLYKVLRAAFARHATSSLPPLPPRTPKVDYGRLPLRPAASLLEEVAALSTVPHGLIMTTLAFMENWNQSTGFVLYTTELPAAVHAGSWLLLEQVHDRAQVFVRDGGERTFVGTVARWAPRTLYLSAAVAVPGATLEILVENMGRSNFGAYMWDPKGVAAVLLDGIALSSWCVYPLPLASLDGSSLPAGPPRSSFVASSVTYGAVAATGAANWRPDEQWDRAAREHLHASTPSGLPAIQAALELQHAAASSVDSPTLFHGVFNISSSVSGAHTWPADTFLDTSGWGKGVAWINGFNLGHYWPTAGPQCTLYVPGPILKHGENELVLLELDASPASHEVVFVKQPTYSCTGSKAPFAERAPEI